MLLLLLLFRFAFQCLEPDVPELLEEVLELGEPFGTCPIQAACAVASLAHEPRLLQDVQVLGDRRTRHVEVRRDLACAQLVVADERKDAAPGRCGDGFERALHRSYLSKDLRKKQLTKWLARGRAAGVVLDVRLRSLDLVHDHIVVRPLDRVFYLGCFVARANHEAIIL